MQLIDDAVSVFQKSDFVIDFNEIIHGLRTPSEGMNQRNLKIWADVADKICFGRT